MAGYHKKVRTFLLSLLCASLWAQASAPAPKPAPAAKPAQAAKPAAPAKPAQAAKPAPAPAPADPVVITVGEEKITKTEFEGLIEALPEKARTELASPQARRQFAENLSEIKALAQEARRRKISDRPSVKRQIQLTEENLLANTLFQDLMNESAPSAEEVKQYYEQHKSEYETAKARHILVRFKGSRVPLREGQPDRTEEEALAYTEGLRKRLLGGEEFAALAKAESDDTGSGADGGNLGEFGRGRMVPVFDQAVFTLPVGQVSEPVKSQFGYHLILVEDRKTKSLEEMSGEIERQQKPAKARDAAEKIRKSAVVVLDENYFGGAPDTPPAPPAAKQ